VGLIILEKLNWRTFLRPRARLHGRGRAQL